MFHLFLSRIVQLEALLRKLDVDFNVPKSIGTLEGDDDQGFAPIAFEAT